MSKVKIYTNANCGACDMTIKFMKENEIEFDELRIDQDEDARDHLVELGVLGVPYLEVGNESILGYDPGKLLSPELLEEEE